jgi:hypothetical protein
MTNYKSYEKTIKGNTWVISVASGKSNYVNILKATNNPFGKIGKFYKTFDEAQTNYKCSELKLFILQVEMGLLNVKETLTA